MKKGSKVQSREFTMAKGKVSLRGLGSTRAVLEDFQKATLKSQNQSIKEKGKTWRFAALSLPEVRTGCKGDAGEGEQRKGTTTTKQPWEQRGNSACLMLTKP